MSGTMKYSTQMNDLDHVSSFFIIALHLTQKPF